MLTNCNALSQHRLKNVAEDYKKHSKLLIEMKKDLEYIFKKIRFVKQKLENKYPEAFEQAAKQQMQNQQLDEEEENSDGELKKEVDYEQLESTKIDAAHEARDSSDSTS